MRPTLIWPATRHLTLSAPFTLVSTTLASWLTGRHRDNSTSSGIDMRGPGHAQRPKGAKEPRLLLNIDAYYTGFVSPLLGVLQRTSPRYLYLRGARRRLGGTTTRRGSGAGRIIEQTLTAHGLFRHCASRALAAEQLTAAATQAGHHRTRRTFGVFRWAVYALVLGCPVRPSSSIEHGRAPSRFLTIALPPHQQLS